MSYKQYATLEIFGKYRSWKLLAATFFLFFFFILLFWNSCTLADAFNNSFLKINRLTENLHHWIQRKCQWWSVKLCKLAWTNSCQFIQLNASPLTFFLEFPELFRKDNTQIPLDTCCLRLMEHTVLPTINGHSKRRAPIISRRFYFPRPNSGQASIKNFLKSRQVISGHSVWRTLFSARVGLFSLFFSPVKGHVK